MNFLELNNDLKRIADFEKDGFGAFLKYLQLWWNFWCRIEIFAAVLKYFKCVVGK